MTGAVANVQIKFKVEFYVPQMKIRIFLLILLLCAFEAVFAQAPLDDESNEVLLIIAAISKIKSDQAALQGVGNREKKVPMVVQQIPGVPAPSSPPEPAIPWPVCTYPHGCSY